MMELTMLLSDFYSSLCAFLVNVAGKDMPNFILFFPSVTINLGRLWKTNWETQRKKMNRKKGRGRRLEGCMFT